MMCIVYLREKWCISVATNWLSLVLQIPVREEKGSDNIVYNELCQTQECGATNQIASFVISGTSHDFAHIIYRANLHCASDVGNNY